MTKSRFDVKPVYESITAVWRVFKKNLETPPTTPEDWLETSHEFERCTNGERFKSELAAACFRELARLDRDRKIKEMEAWNDDQ